MNAMSFKGYQIVISAPVCTAKMSLKHQTSVLDIETIYKPTVSVYADNATVSI